MAAQLCYAEAPKRQISETALRRAKIRLAILHHEPRDLLGLYLPRTWELPHGGDSATDNTRVLLDTGTVDEHGNPKDRRDKDLQQPDPLSKSLDSGTVDKCLKPNC